MRRRSRAAWWLGSWALASLVGWACGTRVARADELRVELAAAACPDAALLEQKLAPLLPDRTLVINADAAAQPPGTGVVAVRDLGARYVIEVAGLAREVDDPARDCTERARVAAVFIALNLGAAPASAAPPEPEPEPEPVASAEPAGDEPARVQIGLRLLGDGAYAPALDRGALGGNAGAWLGYGALRFALTLGAIVPVRVPFAPEPGEVSLLRVPVVASAEYALRLGPVELGPALGVVLDVLRLQGRSLERARTELRLNPGLLLAADVGLRLSAALLVRLRAHATGFARQYALRVEPLGSLGHTPRLWLGASLGLDWQLR